MFDGGDVFFESITFFCSPPLEGVHAEAVEGLDIFFDEGDLVMAVVVVLDAEFAHESFGLAILVEANVRDVLSVVFGRAMTSPAMGVA